MTKPLYLTSKNSVCKLNLDKKTLEEILTDDFTRHFIPDVILSNKPKPHDIEVSGNDLDVPAKISYPTAQYKFLLPGRDIISICEYLLERNRQEKNGFYSLNSATASMNCDAVTFFAGATNSGKTSSMLELITKPGFDFYCDEHSLLDLTNIKIVGGSRSIATRKKILKDKLAHHSEFCHKEFKYNEKNAALFIYPHLDHGLSKPYYYKFKPLDFHWLLTRELGGVIRGVVKVTDNFTYPLPSLDTQELADERVRRTITFANQVPCYYFQGSLQQIAEFVREKFDKK